MKILDIHTHNLSAPCGISIINCHPQAFSPQPECYYSVGYHPWFLSEEGNDDWPLLNRIATHRQVVAIGEAGLDKIRGADYALQEKAFERQIGISLLVRKPLIIHSVKAYNEIISIHKSVKPDVPWIIHGFRGKKEVARQLLDHGMYLSFGEMYQEEALRSVPLDRLLLETDESKVGIEVLYRKAAYYLGVEEGELRERVERNIGGVFF